MFDKFDGQTFLCRLMHCSAVVGSRIYVCGGYDGEYVHSSTESYDSITNTWIEQPKMCIGKKTLRLLFQIKYKYATEGYFRH